MIILQAAGGGGTGMLGLDSSLVGDQGGMGTTFRTNAYIHKLNRTLQAETYAMGAWRRLARHTAAGRGARTGLNDTALRLTEDHRLAARELVRLIILNRGLPEERSTLPVSFGLAPAVLAVCRAMPPSLATPAAQTALASMETSLVLRYQRLVQEAPPRDRRALEALLEAAGKRRDGFGVNR